MNLVQHLHHSSISLIYTKPCSDYYYQSSRLSCGIVFLKIVVGISWELVVFVILQTRLPITTYKMLQDAYLLAFGLVLAMMTTRLFATRYLSSLRKFNGPVLASMTNAWRLNYVYWHRHEPPMLKIHEKYGDIVRMGPNVLAFRQPQALSDIYGSQGRNFTKVMAFNLRLNWC